MSEGFGKYASNPLQQTFFYNIGKIENQSFISTINFAQNKMNNHL